MADQFHLLIDDFRTFEMDHIARTAQEGRKALLAFPVTHLYMDHDLGYESDANGYETMNWMLERGVCPLNVQFVTANPVGRDNMARALEAHGYVNTGVWYTKTESDNG